MRRSQILLGSGLLIIGVIGCGTVLQWQLPYGPMLALWAIGCIALGAGLGIFAGHPYVGALLAAALAVPTFAAFAILSI